MRLTIETTVDATLDDVWRLWTSPEHITQWNAANEDWHCPAASLDLRDGGSFSYRMESRDGEQGFDFEGRFTRVVPNQLIEFVLEDERPVTIEFVVVDNTVRVRKSFEAEDENSGEAQRQGWLAILESFARHAETTLRS